MSEREMIAITGTGGSGKTSLASGIKKGIRAEWSVDHVSFGDYVRDQAGQTQPRKYAKSAFRTAIIDHLHESSQGRFGAFDEPTAQGIMHEIIERSEATVLLLDGFPRYTGQLSQLQDSAARNNVELKGVIITHVDHDLAVSRIVKREDERAISAYNAEKRIRQQLIGMQAVQAELERSTIPLEIIDTYFPKEQTLRRGFQFIDRVITAPKYSYPKAS